MLSSVSPSASEIAPAIEAASAAAWTCVREKLAKPRSTERALNPTRTPVPRAMLKAVDMWYPL